MDGCYDEGGEEEELHEETACHYVCPGFLVFACFAALDTAAWKGVVSQIDNSINLSLCLSPLSIVLA